LGLPAWWWLTARLVVVDDMGLGLVNGVGLGLEVVEPCRIWVFFFLFNFLVLKLWNLTLCGDFVLRN
jgi:hypothetical protein